MADGLAWGMHALLGLASVAVCFAVGHALPVKQSKASSVASENASPGGGE